MKQLYLILMLLLLTTAVASAQDVPLYNLYTVNPYMFNPAKAGQGENAVSMQLDYRKLPRSFDDNSDIALLLFESSFSSNSGLGLRAYTERLGGLEMLQISAAYSYRVGFSADHSLGFGISAGFNRRTINTRRFVANGYVDLSDPTLSSDYFDKLNFEAGLGLNWKYQQLQLNVAAANLVNTRQGTTANFTAEVNYTLEANNLELVPSIFYQSYYHMPNVGGLMMSGTISEAFWAQLGYKSNENAIMGAGYRHKSFGLYYAYELALGKEYNPLSNLHELSLQVSLKEVGKPRSRRR